MLACGVSFADGSGAVHKAAETNNIPMMQRLMALGLDIEQRNKYGETPVVVAALHECTEMVLFLQDKKANMYAKSVDGYIPFQIAVRYGFPEMMQGLNDSGGGTFLAV